MRMTFTYLYRYLTLAVAALAVAGCGSGGATRTFDAGPDCTTVPTYGQLLTATFVPRCSGRCHNGSTGLTPTSPAGPIDLSASSNRSSLVDRASIHGMDLVLAVPGDPGSSFVLRKLTNNLPTDGTLGYPMPQGEAIAWTMIPQTEIDAISCWIAGGAP